MNLGPPTGNVASMRPHQAGYAAGTKAGVLVRVSVEWMIDTGADIGAVQKWVGDSFDLVATGATASPTTGGGGMIIKTGMRAELMAEDPSGVSHTVLASRPVAVKSANSGSDIIGVDQLAACNVTINWNAGARTGALEIPPPPTGAATASFGQSVQPFLNIAAPSQSQPARGIVDHGTWIDVGGVRIPKRLWDRR